MLLMLLIKPNRAKLKELIGLFDPSIGRHEIWMHWTGSGNFRRQASSFPLPSAQLSAEEWTRSCVFLITAASNLKRARGGSLFLSARGFYSSLNFVFVHAFLAFSVTSFVKWSRFRFLWIECEFWLSLSAYWLEEPWFIGLVKFCWNGLFWLKRIELCCCVLVHQPVLL